MAEWMDGKRPRRRSAPAEVEQRGDRKVIPDLPEAPGAVDSPQLPGETPDRSTVPGQWSMQAPPAVSRRRPLTEYGTAQRIADIFRPSPTGEWRPEDFEQSPAPYEELRKVDPRLLPPKRPAPGYETLRALEAREARAALAAELTAAIEAGGSAPVAPVEAAAVAEVVAIPGEATLLGAVGAATTSPAPGELSTGIEPVEPPVTPAAQRGESLTGIAAPAEAVASAAEALTDATQEDAVDGSRQAPAARDPLARAAPPPAVMAGAAAEVAEGVPAETAPPAVVADAAAPTPAVQEQIAVSTGVSTPPMEAVDAPIAPDRPVEDAATIVPAEAPAAAGGFERAIDPSISEAAAAELVAEPVGRDVEPMGGPIPADAGVAVEPGGVAPPQEAGIVGAEAIPASPAAAAPVGAVGEGQRSPVGETCPDDFPVKGNASSKIYHAPGTGLYGATIPEVCFRDAAAAEAAGYRAPRTRGRAAHAEPAAAPKAVAEAESTVVYYTPRTGATETAPAAGAEAAGTGGPTDGGAGPAAEGAAGLGAARGTTGEVVEPAPAPAARGRAQTELATPEGAVRGSGKRHCPPGFPVKGNARSMRYHMPDQTSYEQTIPEFCFKSQDDAERAGFTAVRGRR